MGRVIDHRSVQNRDSREISLETTKDEKDDTCHYDGDDESILCLRRRDVGYQWDQAANEIG